MKVGISQGSQVAQTVKNLPVIQETWVRSWVRKISWRKEWHPTPVFLPGESNGQRSLASYSPWGHKESDTTEQLTHTHTQLPPFCFKSALSLGTSLFGQWLTIHFPIKGAQDLPLSDIQNPTC